MNFMLLKLNSNHFGPVLRVWKKKSMAEKAAQHALDVQYAFRISEKTWMPLIMQPYTTEITIIEMYTKFTENLCDFLMIIIN